MKDEIKEILRNCEKTINEASGYNDTTDKILDYITNLQEQLHQASLDIQELTEKDIGCPSWCDKLTNLQEENERLKELDANYPIEEQLEEALKYENIYKSRNEKAIKYIKTFGSDIDRKNYLLYYNEIINKVLNILNGGDEEC